MQKIEKYHISNNYHSNSIVDLQINTNTCLRLWVTFNITRFLLITKVVSPGYFDTVM